MMQPSPAVASHDRARSEGDDLAIRISGVSKRFGAKVILDRIDLEIRRGQFVVLLGPSGTGKTTLLRILAGLEEADQGVVLVPRVRTIVYQEPRLVQSMRVAANVAIGQPRTQATRDAALRALSEVGLQDHARAWPATLSGGEAQRVALARALVRSPDLLLLDEPFASLDALTRLQMQDLVVRLVAVHRPAALLVTHDPDEALCLADRILILRSGSLALDLRITASRQHDRNDAEFLRTRRLLLETLGVLPPAVGR
jgi:sulfonate transport system ATP-binding protein